MVINLEFPPSKALLNLPREFKIHDENPLNSIKEFIKDFKTEGYFVTFTKHFNLQIILKNPETEEPETEEPETIESAEEWITNFFLPDCVKRRMIEIAHGTMAKELMESRKEKINLEKSFKSSECEICLTSPPNVLFCNCGHIPICEICDETASLPFCPVCKTENYIKRMVK